MKKVRHQQSQPVRLMLVRAIFDRALASEFFLGGKSQMVLARFYSAGPRDVCDDRCSEGRWSFVGSRTPHTPRVRQPPGCPTLSSARTRRSYGPVRTLAEASG